eukprot:295387_1
MSESPKHVRFKSSFQELTEFVKEAAKKVFADDDIATIIYSTIKNEDYDINSILDDIEHDKQCHIMMKISKNIKTSSTKSIKWSEKHNNILYNMLIKIYKDRAINKNEFERETETLSGSLPSLDATKSSIPRSEEAHRDDFINKVLIIIEEINTTMRKRININNVKQLFMKQKHLNQSTIFTTKIAVFEQIAKKYDIKGHHATKIIKKLRLEFENDDEIDFFNDDEKGFVMLDNDDELSASLSTNLYRSGSTKQFDRDQWIKGSNCQIFSATKKKWCKGEINGITMHDTEEWITVIYEVDGVQKQKQIQRFSKDIRPVIEEQNLNLDSPFHLQMSEPSQFQLGEHFDKWMMISLSNKLERVIELLNKEIHSDYDVLYQIYHQRMNVEHVKIEKFITYHHDKSLKHYWALVHEGANKYSISMLCNGAIVKQYGEVDEYKRCNKEALDDYKFISKWCHVNLLNKNSIVNAWNSQKYDSKWLLSTQKEEIVEIFTKDQFKLPTVQIAIRLYNKLLKTIKSTAENEDSVVTKSENDNCDDIMFLWTKKKEDMKVYNLDHTHFLYVVSLVLEKLKKDFEKINIKEMLICLHKIEMNGLMFSKIDSEVFKQSVILHSHAFNEIDLQSLHQLKNCTEKLWEEINNFDSLRKEINKNPSSICSISLSSNIAKNELPQISRFEQWMITFNFQYNMNTPFDFQIFQPLLKTFTDEHKEIINMKYDNYSTDLNEKTYDHVLKSLISWGMTLICDNVKCDEKPKLCCFCEADYFQLYTYNIIMKIIEFKASNDYFLLKMLSDMTTTVSTIAETFVNLLPSQLQPPQNKYFETYKLHITKWINFDFYNFVCIYCNHINKSIMIDRVYHYSKSLDYCRICNKRQISRIKTTNRPQFNINDAVKAQKNAVYRRPDEEKNEFSLHSLIEYLLKSGVDSEDLKKFKSHLRNEQYDSDAIMEDILDESGLGSNISGYIVTESKREKNKFDKLLKQLVNLHRFPTGTNGNLIRYLVSQPKYFSLLKEICLNTVCQLTVEDWEHKILFDVSNEYERNIEKLTAKENDEKKNGNDNKPILSNETDERFGIEIGEPIGINHLIAILLFSDDRFV